MPSLIHGSRIANRAQVAGLLDQQFQGGQEFTRRGTRNELQGAEEQIVLQVASPFGRTYALPLQLTAGLPGSEILSQATAGTALMVRGGLEWVQQRAWPTVLPERSRTTAELVFRGETIMPAETTEELGCDVWLDGFVATPAQVTRHPYKPSILLALTSLQVQTERKRRNSRVSMIETIRIPVAVPLQHPQAPNLLRPGNRVIVEGMLERVIVKLHGPDIDQAVAVLEADWQHRSAELRDQALQTAERQYRWQRRKLCEVARSRVVAGYIELVDGTPATPREARKLRETYTRNLRPKSQL